MSRKIVTLIVLSACLTSFPFSVFADDGLSELAGLIGVGFFLVFLILVVAILTLADSFLSDREKRSDSNLIVKLLKLVVPIGIIVVINAVLVQGYIGLGGFINTLNGVIAFCLVLVCVLAPGQKKLNYVTTSSWLVVALLILYVFWEWKVLSWF